MEHVEHSYSIYPSKLFELAISWNWIHILKGEAYIYNHVPNVLFYYYENISH